MVEFSPKNPRKGEKLHHNSEEEQWCQREKPFKLTNIEVPSFTFSEENSTVVSPPNKVVTLLAVKTDLCRFPCCVRKNINRLCS